VGKSTILNKILDSYVMETGEISDKIERGRHTTRHAELLELKSGGLLWTLPALVLLNFRKLNRKNFKTIILSLETISANVDLPDAAISVNPDVCLMFLSAISSADQPAGTIPTHSNAISLDVTLYPFHKRHLKRPIQKLYHHYRY